MKACKTGSQKILLTVGIDSEKMEGVALRHEDVDVNQYQMKFREVITRHAYLLPPSRRTVARFLNLSQVAEWSFRMQQVFHTLSPKE